MTTSERHYIVIGSQFRTAKQKAALKLRWPSRTLAERFWQKVDKSGECWVWTAYRLKSNYGLFNIRKGKWEYAHRMAWTLAVGEIPLGKDVLHRCDNPPCVRPDHLWLGTHQENMADMRSKGRSRRKRVTSLVLFAVIASLAALSSCCFSPYRQGCSIRDEVPAMQAVFRPHFLVDHPAYAKTTHTLKTYRVVDCTNTDCGKEPTP